MRLILIIIYTLSILSFLDAQDQFKSKISKYNHDGIEFGSQTFGTEFEFLILGEQNGATTVGLHFDSVNLPENSIVDSAYLQFSSAENSVFDDEIQISIELNGQSSPFPDGGLGILWAREKSENWIDWKISGLWQINDRTDGQRTTDIKELVSEVKNLPEWKSGNPMTFFLFSEFQTGIELWAFDAGFEEHYPELIIYYSTPSSTQIEELEKELSLKPNPFSTELILDGNLKSRKGVSLSFFNSIGAKIYEAEINGAENIQADFLPNGLYFVQIKSDDEILKTEKMIKVQ